MEEDMVAITQGCDYSFSRPSPSCLAADGMRFVGRYTCVAPSTKRMEPREVHALNAVGLQVFTIHQEEQDKGWMLRGGDAGVAAAKASLAQAGACGMPPGKPHYYALDVDPRPLTEAQWQRVQECLEGAASVHGLAATRVYGGFLAIERLVPRFASAGFQTSSWSDGRWSSKAVLQQYRHNVEQCHGLIDLTQAVAADYGGWRAAKMQLVTRAQWSARAPKNRTSLDRNTQRGTAVHYSGSAAEAKDSHSLCAGVVRGIQDFHMDSRKWADIAYSYLPCNHGFVFEGRGRGIRTAGQGTDAGNDAYHAVCFLGGDSAGRADVTPAGRLAVRQAVEFCNAWAGVGDVRPHSFFKATECPGDELRAWIIQGMPVINAPAPPEKEEPLKLDAEDRDAIRKIVTTEVINLMRTGFGGLKPGATGDGVRDSQTWLFGQVAGQASRLQAIEDQLASLAPALGDPTAIAKSILEQLAVQLAPRP